MMIEWSNDDKSGDDNMPYMDYCGESNDEESDDDNSGSVIENENIAFIRVSQW
jgi:hypothetical protein